MVELISEKYPGTFYVMNWRWGELLQKGPGNGLCIGEIGPKCHSPCDSHLLFTLVWILHKVIFMPSYDSFYPFSTMQLA